MFRRIRSRLIAAFAVPLALLVAVTSVAAWGSWRSEQTVSQQSNLALAANGPSGIVNALQNERDEATADLVGLGAEAHLAVKSNADARHQTDVALAAFRSSVVSAGGSTEKVFQPALDSLSQLGAVRSQVDAYQGARSLADAGARAVDVATFDQYAGLIDGFLRAIAVAPQYISDPSLRSSVETLDLFLNQSEALTLVAQQMFSASLLHAASPVGSIVPGADLGAFESWTPRLQAYTSGPDGAVVTGVVAGAGRAAAAMTPFVHDVTGGQPLNVLAFTQALAPIGNVWQGAAVTVGQHISARAASLRTSAELRAILYGLGALASVLLVVFILLRVSRSISAPLTRLASDAQRMADHDLPAAVEAIFSPAVGGASSEESAESGAGSHPADSTDGLAEVQEVAGALDALQRRALELATEQATLRRKVADAYVNLGRRNQNLVSRQLELISQIEQQEEDPATLEELFRLDHLTTRMRRHAESLLVIAGSGALRSWSEAASAVDAVRAASAEVEDYQRLRLHHFDHAVVSATATTDLVHILAELMENALSFSPPHASVGLYGRALDSGYTISVVDAGIGLTPEARDAANRRLASGGDLDDAANRCLGLLVAGRLASRHGIQVTLHDSDAGGVTARVSIPAALIESSVTGPSEVACSPVLVELPTADSGGGAAAAGVYPGTAPGGHLHRSAAPVARSVSPAPGGALPRPDAAEPSPNESRFEVAPVVAPTLAEASGPPLAPGGLPRRIPGATLGPTDDSLRRDRTPAPQTPWAVSYALTDYLNSRAEPPSGRPPTEA